MRYYRDMYFYGGGTAIHMRTDEGEPVAQCSVNLMEYDMCPPDENHVFVPIYKLSDEIFNQFKEDLVDYIVYKVPIGYTYGVMVKLKDNWKELTESVL